MRMPQEFIKYIKAELVCFTTASIGYYVCKNDDNFDELLPLCVYSTVCVCVCTPVCVFVCAVVLRSFLLMSISCTVRERVCVCSIL